MHREENGWFDEGVINHFSGFLLSLAFWETLICFLSHHQIGFKCTLVHSQIESFSGRELSAWIRNFN